MPRRASAGLPRHKPLASGGSSSCRGGAVWKRRDALRAQNDRQSPTTRCVAGHRAPDASCPVPKHWRVSWLRWKRHRHERVTPSVWYAAAVTITTTHPQPHSPPPNPPRHVTGARVRGRRVQEQQCGVVRWIMSPPLTRQTDTRIRADKTSDVHRLT